LSSSSEHKSDRHSRSHNHGTSSPAASGPGRGLFLLAVLGGALSGAGGYWLADHLRQPPPAPVPVAAPPQAPPAPPIAAVDLAKLWSALADLDERLAQLEAQPAVPGEPPGPGPAPVGDKPQPQPRPQPRPSGPRPPAGPITRPVQPPPPQQQPPAPLTDYRRMEMAAAHRAEYEQMLNDLRGVLGAEPAAWNALQTILAQHFAPVEVALKDLEAGKSSAAPPVNELVRPGLPGLLAAIRGACSPERWAAFDAWRRSVGDVAGRWTTRGDYLLDGQDYLDYQARLAAGQYWPAIRDDLGRFAAAAKLNEAGRRKVEDILKAHLDKVCAVLQGEDGRDLADPRVMERIRPLAKATEAEIGAAVGPAALAGFKEWETAAGGRVSYFFGKPPRPWIGDVVTRGYTAELLVDVDGRKPNLLVADGRETTEVVFRDLGRRPGLQVRFSADCGRIETDPKLTDERGVARAVYTADSRTSTATVKAEVAGEGEGGGALVLATYVYNEEFNFRDLSKNKGVGGYTDEAFVRNDAMTREQIQAFLEARGSFLASYSEGGRSAAEIIKAAADRHGVNPKVILVTLQKEQSLVLRKKALPADATEMRNAMGVRPKLAQTFAAQVDVGARVLRQRFDEPIAFFPVPVKNKYGPDGRATQAFRESNHIYVVPSTGAENVWAPVGFEPLTRATHAQHRYTNYVTHRTDSAAASGKWQLPCGGVYLFVSTWQKLIGE